MNRHIFNLFKEEFSKSFLMYYSCFSGAASLVSPGAGKHLRVYDITFDGPADLSQITSAEFQDGSSSPVGCVFLAAGAHREFDFLGRYWKVDTSLRIVRPDRQDNICVKVLYREHDNNE